MSPADMKPHYQHQTISDIPTSVNLDGSKTSPVSRSHGTVMAMLTPPIPQPVTSSYGTTSPHNEITPVIPTPSPMTSHLATLPPSHRPMIMSEADYLHRTAMTTSPSPVITSWTSPQMAPLSTSSLMMSSAGLMSHTSLYDAPQPPKAVPVSLEQAYGNGQDHERGSPRIKSEIVNLPSAVNVSSNWCTKREAPSEWIRKRSILPESPWGQAVETNTSWKTSTNYFFLYWLIEIKVYISLVYYIICNIPLITIGLEQDYKCNSLHPWI